MKSDMRSGKTAFLLVFCFTVIINAGDKKRIYIAADDHTDYLWSADENGYRDAFVEMLDYYIAMADSTVKTEPPPYQSRFSCDGSYWMWNYEKSRSPEQFQRLIDHIKSGHITVPLTLLTLCYGGMPAEAVIRSMIYAGKIERRYNLRFPLAVPMEDQTMPAGVGSLWAGAGAKYCWMGICGCASRIHFQTPRAHEIYWWTGLDGSKVLTKWNSLNDNPSLKGYANESLGGYAEARRPHEAIHYVENDSGFKSRYPYPVIGIFGKGWDDLKTRSIEFIEAAKSRTHENRQVIVSNEIDFFQDFETTCGSAIPSFLAGFGNEWDILPASMAGLTARVKNATEKLRSAEAISALVSLQDSGFMNGREDAREQAFINMGLFWNHDWTADGPVSKADYQRWARNIVAGMENYVDSLFIDARAQLGDLITKRGPDIHVYAFNPLGWIRSDIAQIPVSDDNPVHVVDLSTGKETPSQITGINGRRHVRWLAQAVPSVGYKVFEVRPGKGKLFPAAATRDGNVLENNFYRLTVADRGAITNLIDKKRGNAEFVRAVHGRAVNDLGEGSGKMEIEDAGPVTLTVAIKSPSPLRHETRITLYRHSDRIDIHNRILQNFNSTGDDPPRWAFGFALNHPDIRHEEVGAVIRAKLLSDGGHYSPTHARYDWLTLNHFVNISGDNKSVTLSNQDCCFFKTGRSTVDTLDVNTPQVSVLIGGQIDGPALGIPGHGGDTLFNQRFALRTGSAFDQTEAMRFSLEHQNPLVTGTVEGRDGRDGAFPEDEFSLLDVSDANVLLWALKPAEDGISKAGLVARFWNMGAESSQFDVHFKNCRIMEGKEITHVETPIREAVVSEHRLKGSLSPFQLKSFSIKAKLSVASR